MFRTVELCVGFLCSVLIRQFLEQTVMATFGEERSIEDFLWNETPLKAFYLLAFAPQIGIPT